MKIVWSAQAVDDLKALREYIADVNPPAAADVALRIVEAVEHLAEFPEKGRLGRLPHTRELVIQGTPFIAPYRVRSERLEIIAVIHGARRWPE